MPGVSNLYIVQFPFKKIHVWLMPKHMMHMIHMYISKIKHVPIEGPTEGYMKHWISTNIIQKRYGFRRVQQ